MSGTLFDTNVWLAAFFRAHPGHKTAQRRLTEATAAVPAALCRQTQLSFLRLVSTPALLAAYDVAGFANKDAVAVLHAFTAMPNVRTFDEAPGTNESWLRLAAVNTASPKVWMDAYLAAFAITSGLALATFDTDFRNFVGAGLDLEVLVA
ncbi:MAG: PIN domain-containing protein [Burkholderiales bacterium]|nr:PIN domain-containing protein [Burkholderiales bacterium]